MLKRELGQGSVVPVFHEPWMRSRWSFMRLRHRSTSASGQEFLVALRAANAACVIEDARLESRWRERMPTGAGSTAKRIEPARQWAPLSRRASGTVRLTEGRTTLLLPAIQAGIGRLPMVSRAVQRAFGVLVRGLGVCRERDGLL